jgi:hypothetical protein
MDSVLKADFVNGAWQGEHARIMQDLPHVCEVAGVQPKFMHESMVKYCGPVEVDWVRKFHQYRREGCPGLLLQGGPRPDTRCQAIGAALVRNYIDARVIPLNRLLDLGTGNDTVPTPTVLLIPNLCIVSMGKSLPAWKIQQIYDVLLYRSVQSKPSVVYVEGMAEVERTYGLPIADFLSNFKVVA